MVGIQIEILIIEVVFILAIKFSSETFALLNCRVIQTSTNIVRLPFVLH